MVTEHPPRICSMWCEVTAPVTAYKSTCLNLHPKSHTVQRATKIVAPLNSCGSCYINWNQRCAYFEFKIFILDHAKDSKVSHNLTSWGFPPGFTRFSRMSLAFQSFHFVAFFEIVTGNGTPSVTHLNTSLYFYLHCLCANRRMYYVFFSYFKPFKNAILVEHTCAATCRYHATLTIIILSLKTER